MCDGILARLQDIRTESMSQPIGREAQVPHLLLES